MLKSSHRYYANSENTQSFFIRTSVDRFYSQEFSQQVSISCSRMWALLLSSFPSVQQESCHWGYIYSQGLVTLVGPKLQIQWLLGLYYLCWMLSVITGEHGLHFPYVHFSQLLSQGHKGNSCQIPVQWSPDWRTLTMSTDLICAN